MSGSTFDVLQLGDYFFDQIFTGLQELPSLGREIFSTGITSTGGAMFITAVALRRLGTHVGWVAQFGDDYYSEFVRNLCIEEDLDLSLVRYLNHPFRRVTCSLPLAGERAFVTYADPDPDDTRAFHLHQVETASYRHLHIGGLEGADVLKPLSRLARARGATISMDCQDSPLLCQKCDWADLLSYVDVFMPNAREALIVSETESVPEALRVLADLVRTVVIKDGARGAWVAHSGKAWLVPGITVDHVVDTTGAGDCFNAGFLHGCVVMGLPCEQAARYGNICGGLSVTGVGGATNAPTYDELMQRLPHSPDCTPIAL